MDALDAYESIRLAEQLHDRLTAACTAVENKRVIKDEKGWLAIARDLLATDRELGRSLIERTRMLPELLEVRLEFAAGLQQLWVDALEKLLAGITFHAGSRAPIIETLFPHQKFPALRKANREAVTAYQAELERRMKMSYSVRILGEESFAFAKPCIESIQRAYAEWMTSFSSETMPEEQAKPLREEMVALGERLEVLIRQAKLLAEAALVPVKDGFEEYGLNVKARKRGKRKLEAMAEELPPIEAVASEGEVRPEATAAEMTSGPGAAAENLPTAPVDHSAAPTEGSVEAAVPEAAPTPKKSRKKKQDTPEAAEPA